MALGGGQQRVHFEFDTAGPRAVDVKVNAERVVIEDGGELFRFSIARPDHGVDKSELKMHVNFTIEASFGRQRITLGRLNLIHRYVNKIVASFVPAFRPWVLVLRGRRATTTLNVYAHLWPDAVESTRTAVGAVLTARADSLRASSAS